MVLKKYWSTISRLSCHCWNLTGIISGVGCVKISAYSQLELCIHSKTEIYMCSFHQSYDSVCIILFYKIIVELKACVQASFPVPQLAVNVDMPWIICLHSDTCGHTAHYTCKCKGWQRRSARFSNSTRAGHYWQLWLFIAAVALLVKIITQWELLAKNWTNTVLL